MRNKIGLILVIAMSLTAVLSAAERTSPIPPQPSDKKSKEFGRYLVRILPTLPASVTNDDPLTPYTEKIKPVKGITSEWFFIHVRFPVYAMGGRTSAGMEWLDDVEVMVEVGIRGRNKRGQDTYVVLQGRQKLNSICANDDTHNVRFFIPPYAIFRHIVGLQEKPDLKKLADELPVLVTIFWRDKPISYIMRSRDVVDASRRSTYFSTFEKLRDSKSNYYEGVILPAEYTPWAARDLDRFESMKIEHSGSR